LLSAGGRIDRAVTARCKRMGVKLHLIASRRLDM
jgi:hypothetical protein